MGSKTTSFLRTICPSRNSLIKHVLGIELNYIRLDISDILIHVLICGEMALGHHCTEVREGSSTSAAQLTKKIQGQKYVAS